MDRDGQIGWSNRALALLLACVLGALWLRNDWHDLARGVLPDSDDMVRMAQVRDWLAGQSFTDLTQHRLGIGGSGTLHWSRLGDLGIVAWILALRPMLGAAQAEIWAAILWPLTLFALALMASARVALRLGNRGHATLAVLIAAFAFPAITMFVPGRIDHHGLQIVLTLALVAATMRAPSVRGGAMAGLVAAATLAVGLETAPLVLVAVAVLGVLWVVAGAPERRRLAGFAIALGGATLGWFAVARTDVWPAGWCDGFTPASSAATLAAAFACGLLAAITPVLRGPAWRIGAAAIVGGATLVSIWPISSVCLTGPYGPVDPVLARLWLAHVEEARPLFADGIGKALAFGGLSMVALAVTAAMAWRTRERGWLILLSFQTAALAITVMQLRGSALAAALAAPALAFLVAGARARGNVLLLAGAWVASAGLAWSMIGRLLEDRPVPAATLRGADCTAPDTLGQLAVLPAGLMIAPIDAGAYILGSTPHRVLAAPYHRNNAGNRAAYDFWLATPDAGRGQAVALHADYVLACPDAFGGIDMGKTSMATQIANGAVPDWLVPVPLTGSAARLYRVLPPPSRGR